MTEQTIEMLVESIELRARTPRASMTQEEYVRFLTRVLVVLGDMKYYAASHSEGFLCAGG